MKKIVLILTICTFSISMAQIKVAMDIGGSAKLSGSGVEMTGSAKSGFTLGYDHVLGGSDALSYGAGLEYQLSREAEIDFIIITIPMGKFGFTSLHGFVNYGFGEKHYVGFKVGYALMLSGDDEFSSDTESTVDGSGTTITTTTTYDLKGGIGYGFHYGYNINDNMAVELGYKSNAGKVGEGDFTYSGLRATFNYSL